MNAPEHVRHMEFVDLKSQYAALRESINARIQRVLDHGQYIMGPEVQELEEQLQAFTGSKHCITVSSGTEALLISLMAVGLKAGDEVITSPFTFAATAETIVLAGGTPVFVDIEPDTCNIDVSKIEAAIAPRTQAIMPVSLYGQVADMDEINAIAPRHGNLPVIEDAAQSFGTTYKGRRSCNLSTFGCTSFFPSKPLCCYGDGGAIFTSDDALAQACREIRVQGWSKRYHHTGVWSGRAHGHAALRRRAVQARSLRIGAGAKACIGHPMRSAACEHAWAALASRPPGPRFRLGQYTVFVTQRNRVQSTLKDLDIPTAAHYPKPLHLQPAYAHHGSPGGCPKSVAAGEQVMSLPMSADLATADQNHVIDNLVAVESEPAPQP